MILVNLVKNKTGTEIVKSDTDFKLLIIPVTTRWSPIEVLNRLIGA